MKTLITTALLFVTIFCIHAQVSHVQYFDGDSLPWWVVEQVISLDTSASNVWQIGPPQKSLFDSAASAPNVLITDTVNPYPPNDTSEVEFHISIRQWYNGVLAVKWMQQLDLDSAKDYALIEASKDGGLTWFNAFNSNLVYNFYGFDTANVDNYSATRGDGFTATDSNWHEVWFCLQYYGQSSDTSLDVRFTIISDSIDSTGHNGWMIDNIRIEETLFHTIQPREFDDYLSISPNPTTGVIYIEAFGLQATDKIEWIEVFDDTGKMMQRYDKAPSSYSFDISNLANGLYYIKIKTTTKTEKFKVVLQQ